MSVGFLSMLGSWALKSFGLAASKPDMLRAQYQQAVEAMPDEIRIIFLLHCVHELNYRAIAVERGLSIADVEQHLIDALRIVAALVPDPFD